MVIRHRCLAAFTTNPYVGVSRFKLTFKSSTAFECTLSIAGCIHSINGENENRRSLSAVCKAEHGSRTNYTNEGVLSLDPISRQQFKVIRNEPRFFLRSARAHAGGKRLSECDLSVCRLAFRRQGRALPETRQYFCIHIINRDLRRRAGAVGTRYTSMTGETNSVRTSRREYRKEK
ncbi:hypothetical protein EVAR_40250_1 [Eumeta japonica]|uniref:Uncharacterized protein n=1 Tax=Eumeta variegata TaxID=151549 RepID=A0A4C1Y2M9_EUMVA|nr:hypothetical protein EVAR_40250_1 [Eumeta japonica]